MTILSHVGHRRPQTGHRIPTRTGMKEVVEKIILQREPSHILLNILLQSRSCPVHDTKTPCSRGVSLDHEWRIRGTRGTSFSARRLTNRWLVLVVSRVHWRLSWIFLRRTPRRISTFVNGGLASVTVARGGFRESLWGSGKFVPGTSLPRQLLWEMYPMDA